MEIGVLNGDNAKNMIENATQNASHESVEYYGFDLFASYRRRQVAQKLEKMGYKFELFEGDSVETLPKAVKMLPKMDLIFIDGGKCFAEAQSDWQNSRTLMHDGTTVFVHNYEFPGVHKMVDNISRDKY